MTSFEYYFDALKKAIGESQLFDIWPDFEPDYDEREYSWTKLKGLGETLLLNCGHCDGPSDMRHKSCVVCVKGRDEIAKKSYQKSIGHKIEKWSKVILCRIHTM